MFLAAYLSQMLSILISPERDCCLSKPPPTESCSCPNIKVPPPWILLLYREKTRYLTWFNFFANLEDLDTVVLRWNILMEHFLNQLLCTSDIATGLRHGGWGRYRQRGRYLCNGRAPSSIGAKVAIGSAAAISKVAISNGHCNGKRISLSFADLR